MTLLIVLPTYNERPNIERVAAGILRHDWSRLLVVDDASPDGTADAALALGGRYPGRVEVLRRQGPRGLGLAYVDGLAHALKTGAEAIGQMDADLSHNPEHLPALRDALARYDLVIGSRYVAGGGVVNWPVHRIALSAFANRQHPHHTGLATRDCTSVFACGAATRSPSSRSQRARQRLRLSDRDVIKRRATAVASARCPSSCRGQEGYSKVSKRCPSNRC
jgi:dolichol-phosphate mannosyltransferase